MPPSGHMADQIAQAARGWEQIVLIVVCAAAALGAVWLGL